MWRSTLAILGVVWLAAVPCRAGDEPEDTPETPADSTEAPGPPRFALHGFANVNFRAQSISSGGERSSISEFEVGELDLLLTAEFGTRGRFLSEVVFEPEEETDQGPAIDVERLWMRYDFSDAGWVAVGRDHTPLGWWNSFYHHGLLLMPTIRRPRIIDFEDHGGVLPLHMTGLESRGNLRGRAWGLAGAGAVVNGRSPTPDDVSAFSDLNSQKGVVLQAEAVRIVGLQQLRFGVSGYWDTIPPDPVDPTRPVSIKERIEGAHAVVDDPRILFATEYYRIRHEAEGTADSTRTSGGYALFLYKPWAWKPYAGYDELSVPDDDPYFIDYGTDYHRWLLGVRRDLHPFVTLKVEAWRERRADDEVSTLAAQIAVGF